MFKQRKGISPTALVIGSTMLVAALSPQIRQKISGFITGQMNNRNAQNKSFDLPNVGDMMKQAFGGNNQDQSQNRQQTGRQHQHAGQQQSQPQQHQSQSKQNRQTDTTTRNRQQQYAEPIHFDQSAMNVMDDNTVMEMLEDLEPGR
ncbi:hypothetical protein [Bacillus mojavensis]|uniref:hypothetical protein n=1 Tax=Bacillus mojavensis TaxID=72360 RepID=UPI002DBFC81C|nr:hypothetical protein [Bacillus mojavensis]MEC1290538.1 hypothetical protein [Bacillus mojavensis]MEC1615060.1 hypothetical protein [Bacillus mojavensis]MEC1623017.1 hypothetical protein [Bacillus mojavensis]MEC1659106.1 hypothetical protein [Bacillus mojavensis]MEC1684193.1 hypothetical protein [Bacillus mojavensis]